MSAVLQATRRPAWRHSSSSYSACSTAPAQCCCPCFQQEQCIAVSELEAQVQRLNKGAIGPAFGRRRHSACRPMKPAAFCQSRSTSRPRSSRPAARRSPKSDKSWWACASFARSSRQKCGKPAGALELPVVTEGSRHGKRYVPLTKCTFRQYIDIRRIAYFVGIALNVTPLAKSSRQKLNFSGRAIDANLPRS
eukprot:4412322-Pleurochrysis_carterae.AAC.1